MRSKHPIEGFNRRKLWHAVKACVLKTLNLSFDKVANRRNARTAIHLSTALFFLNQRSNRGHHVFDRNQPASTND